MGHGGVLEWNRGSRRLAIAGLAVCLVGLLAALAGTVPDASSSASGPAALSDSYGKLPLAFAPNRGNLPGDVKYSTSTAAGSIALTSNGAVIAPRAKGASPVRMRLAGAAASVPAGQGRLPGVVNDFRGSDSSQWKTGIPTFSRVSYPGAYPGIGVDYYGHDGTLEYDFKVAAGADPSQIGIDFGTSPLRLAGNGDLLIGRGDAAIRQHAPVAYQPGPEGRTPVSSRFELHNGTVGFQLGAYDHSQPLVIDPLVLAYSTLLGGADWDEVLGSTVDSSGNQYLVGDTFSTDFPKQGAIDGSLSGTYDAFVTKMNPTGTALLYSTYLGGSGSELANDVAVDSNGNAYVTGQTSSADFPHTAGAYHGTINNEVNNSHNDVFVTKLNSTGSALDYSTFIGGNNDDEGDAIAVDSSGSAYVTGITHSFTDNTVTPAQTPYPVHNQFPGGSESANGFGDDAFVTKLNSTGTSLDYSSYLDSTGANDVSQGAGIAVDSTGHAYVTGLVSGTNFPKVNQYEGASTPNGTSTIDAFFTKFAANGQSLDYSTYFGGDHNDSGADIAIDSSGRAFIAGGTVSGDSFDSKNAYQTHQGQVFNDAFLTEFDPSQSGANSLVYSSLLGGTQGQGASAVAVDSAGDAYIGGVTEGATSFPQVNGLAATPSGSLFIAKFDTDQSGAASVVYSTTIPGTSDEDTVAGIGTVGTDAYFAGRARTASFPTTAGAFQTSPQGTHSTPQGYASKLTFSQGSDTTPPNTTITGGPTNGSTTSDTTPTFSFTSSEAGSTFQCRFDSAAFSACTTPFTPTTPLSNGSHTFEVRATDGSNNTDQSPASVTFTVNSGPPPDTTPPQTTISDAPAKTIKSKHLPVNVKFSFKSSEAGATFKCKLDSGSYKSCSSPKKYSLGKGKHKFSVESTDASGNQDTTADTATVTVEKKKKKKHHHHHHH